MRPISQANATRRQEVKELLEGFRLKRNQFSKPALEAVAESPSSYSSKPLIESVLEVENTSDESNSEGIRNAINDAEVTELATIETVADISTLDVSESTQVVEAPIVEAPIVEAPIVEAPIVEAPIVEAGPKDCQELNLSFSVSPNSSQRIPHDISLPELSEEQISTLASSLARQIFDRILSESFEAYCSDFLKTYVLQNLKRAQFSQNFQNEKELSK